MLDWQRKKNWHTIVGSILVFQRANNKFGLDLVAIFFLFVMEIFSKFATVAIRRTTYILEKRFSKPYSENWTLSTKWYAQERSFSVVINM